MFESVDNPSISIFLFLFSFLLKVHNNNDANLQQFILILYILNKTYGAPDFGELHYNELFL